MNSKKKQRCESCDLKFKLKELKKKFTMKNGQNLTHRQRKKIFKKFQKDRKKLEKVLNSEKVLK